MIDKKGVLIRMKYIRWILLILVVLLLFCSCTLIPTGNQYIEKYGDVDRIVVNKKIYYDYPDTNWELAQPLENIGAIDGTEFYAFKYKKSENADFIILRNGNLSAYTGGIFAAENIDLPEPSSDSVDYMVIHNLSLDGYSGVEIHNSRLIEEIFYLIDTIEYEAIENRSPSLEFVAEIHCISEELEGLYYVLYLDLLEDGTYIIEKKNEMEEYYLPETLAKEIIQYMRKQ